MNISKSLHFANGALSINNIYMTFDDMSLLFEFAPFFIPFTKTKISELLFEEPSLFVHDIAKVISEYNNL